jgi:hypothetical protein
MVSVILLIFHSEILTAEKTRAEETKADFSSLQKGGGGGGEPETRLYKSPIK